MIAAIMIDTTRPSRPAVITESSGKDDVEQEDLHDRTGEGAVGRAVCSGFHLRDSRESRACS